MNFINKQYIDTLASVSKMLNVIRLYCVGRRTTIYSTAIGFQLK